jgi:hypothetical protein
MCDDYANSWLIDGYQDMKGLSITTIFHEARQKGSASNDPPPGMIDPHHILHH